MIKKREKAKTFRLPYIMTRVPQSFDTTTLNYNWQIWETNAYSLYSKATERIDIESANQVIEAILRYLIADGAIKGDVGEDTLCRVIDYADLVSLRSEEAGLYLPCVSASDHVQKGQVLGTILSSTTGEVKHTFTAPCDGIVFSQTSSSVIYPLTGAFKILPDEN